MVEIVVSEGENVLSALCVMLELKGYEIIQLNTRMTGFFVCLLLFCFLEIWLMFPMSHLKLN